MTDDKQKPQVLERTAAMLMQAALWLMVLTVLAAIAVFLYFNWQVGAERNRLMGQVQETLQHAIEQTEVDTDTAE